MIFLADLQAIMRIARFSDALARSDPLASLIELEPRLTDAELEELVPCNYYAKWVESNYLR